MNMSTFSKLKMDPCQSPLVMNIVGRGVWAPLLWSPPSLEHPILGSSLLGDPLLWSPLLGDPLLGIPPSLGPPLHPVPDKSRPKPTKKPTKADQSWPRPTKADHPTKTDQSRPNPTKANQSRKCYKSCYTAADRWHGREYCSTWTILCERCSTLGMTRLSDTQWHNLPSAHSKPYETRRGRDYDQCTGQNKETSGKNDGKGGEEDVVQESRNRKYSFQQRQKERTYEEVIRRSGISMQVVERTGRTLKSQL